MRPSQTTVMGFYCIDWFSFAYSICGLYFLHNTLFQKAWCLTVCSLKNVNFLFGQQELFCCCWLDSNAFMCRHIQTVNAHILMPTVICRCCCKTLGFLNMSLGLRRCVAGSETVLALWTEDVGIDKRWTFSALVPSGANYCSLQKLEFFWLHQAVTSTLYWINLQSKEK